MSVADAGVFPVGDGVDAAAAAPRADGASTTPAGADAAEGAGPVTPGTVLDHYVAAGDPFFVADSGRDNLSGITWNPDTGTYFGVIDSSGLIYEVAADMSSTLRGISIVGSDLDYEGICYLGSEQYALVRESNVMIIVTITATTTSVGSGARELRVADPPAGFNSGAEAVAFDPDAGAGGRFWVMQEIDPMRVFTFERPVEGGAPVVAEPFDPEATLGVADISDAVFDPRTGHLLILSQEDHRIVEVVPETGEVLETLELPASFGASEAKWEGLALRLDGVLAVAAEGLGAQNNRAQLYDYRP
jgi:uncharacterized protein YjiK